VKTKRHALTLLVLKKSSWAGLQKPFPEAYLG